MKHLYFLQTTEHSSWVGTAIVIAVLVLLVVLAFRKLRRKDDGCSGSCAGCAGCGDTDELLKKLKTEHPDLYREAMKAKQEYKDK